ncbi:AMP-binding protein [Staphylococcus ratti]|uniref:Putative long chain fatty acid-CoA ligase VraA n=1 Tax=Staphylococcus ratti TaxID=2892440 RepID=A0ABY3PC29_9STAP|nr:AMP-binding protein [Staphylococcus ratti]UEX89890.1 AMP-binding protein [Staphylococcus ratti]
MELLTRLSNYARKQPERCALYIDGEQLHYEALYHQAASAAQQLPNECIGHYVALTFDRIQDFVTAYLAVLMKGATPCVMDAKWSSNRRIALHKQYHISFIWNVEGLRRTGYEGVSERQPNLLHIGFTSGTTGLPKAFYRDEASWIASFEQNECLICEDKKDPTPIMVALGPYAHSLTLYVIVYALFYGRTFMGQNDYHIATCANRIAHFGKPCTLFVVPTMVYDWLQHVRETQQIKNVFISGDKLTPELHQQLKAVVPMATLYEFFGTSEASFISVNADQTAPLASVGKVFPNVDILIKAPDDNGIGRLFVKSPMVFSGYLGQEKPKWIATGDYARIENDFLYLHGRVQDRMIIGGRNVYPSVIEQHLKMIDGIEDVVIVRRPHTKFGELAIAIYVGATNLTYSKIRRKLSPTLSRYEIPSKLIRVSALPLTSSGKVSRQEAQLLYESGEFNE